MKISHDIWAPRDHNSTYFTSFPLLTAFEKEGT
jgi:hypothetical protein